MATECERAALGWQIGVWDRIAAVYIREIDRRFAPVVEQVISRAALEPGEQVLDLGTGAGAIAIRAAGAVGSHGHVLGVDISSDMLALARQRTAELSLSNVSYREGRAEDIPAVADSVDALLASLSLMYAIDREAAAREIARVLRPGGRFVAAVWAGPESCDIVQFQQIAGSFAPAPPVAGVGPGVVADPTPFLDQLAKEGMEAHVETATLGFDFPDFASAWDVLAGVTAALLPTTKQQAARSAVLSAMWPDGDGPRSFRNLTQFIMGHRR
jgi:SAM-dependent methyltransferase